MKLIIEKSDSIYVYREDEEHFKNAEKSRKRRRLKRIKFGFDEECNTSYMSDNSYVVVDIAYTKENKMNRDSAKAFLPIIQAYSEGKNIQMFDGKVWLDMDDSYIAFNGPVKDYRVKSELKYRPYNEKEMRQLVGKTISNKGNDYLVYSFKFIDNDMNFVVISHGFFAGPQTLLEHYTIDGKPCGVEE